MTTTTTTTTTRGELNLLLFGILLLAAGSTRSDLAGQDPLEGE